MKSAAYITKRVNALRSREQMRCYEFRDELRKIISYSSLPTFLIDSGFAQRIGNSVIFDSKPIHISKIERWLANNRVSNKKYTLSEAISLLKSRGYEIIKIQQKL